MPLEPARETVTGDQATTLEAWARACLQEPTLRGADYAEVAVVTFYKRRAVTQYAFRYDSAGSATAWAPQNDDTLRWAHEVRAKTAAGGAPTWDVCLLTVSLTDSTIDCDFFSGADARRWMTRAAETGAAAEWARPSQVTGPPKAFGPTDF
jgi:hypothetical protein